MEWTLVCIGLSAMTYFVRFDFRFTEKPFYAYAKRISDRKNELFLIVLAKQLTGKAAALDWQKPIGSERCCCPLTHLTSTYCERTFQ